MRRGGLRYWLLAIAAIAAMGFSICQPRIAIADPLDDANNTATTQTDSSNTSDNTGADNDADSNSESNSGSESTSSQTNNNSNSNSSDKSSSKDKDEDTCEKGFFGFGWLLCPGQNLVTTVMNFFLGLISDQMSYTAFVKDPTVIQTIWRRFLDIANIVFAILFMLLIYSMALPGSLLSNYNVKKILPRFILMAVAVNLSFYICAALVDISNIAGKGLYELIVNQIAGSGMQNLGANIASSALGVVGAAIAIIFFGGAAIISLLIIILALVVRQLALTVLVIISPIMFALMALPNTQKFGDKMFNLFIQMLIIYPAFMVIWGGCQLLSYISAKAGGSIPFLTDIACAVAPALAIIPLFKGTSGFFGKVTTQLDKRAKGVRKSANAVVRQGVANTERGRAFNSGISRNAQRLQNFANKYAATRPIARSASLNSLINLSGNIDRDYDKRLMDKADEWAGNMSSAQAKELLTSEDHSYTDGDGRTIVVNDPYRIRAALKKAKDNKQFGAEDWSKSMRYTGRVIADLRKHHRNVEADKLSDEFITTSKEADRLPINSTMVKAYFDNTNPKNDDRFDVIYGYNVGRQAINMQQSKIKNINSADLTHIRRSMENTVKESNLSRVPANMQNAVVDNYNYARQNMANTAQSMYNNKKSYDKLDTSKKEDIMALINMRTISQVQAADNLHLDKIYKKNNDAAKKYQNDVSNMASSATLDADKRELYNAPELQEARRNFNLAITDPHSQQNTDFINLSMVDKNNFSKVSRYTTNHIPSPIKKW